jgi:hypothetical protein
MWGVDLRHSKIHPISRPKESIMPAHATAPAKELEIKTIPYDLRVGVKPTALRGPRPDLAGLRVKLPTVPHEPNTDKIYVIDPDGYRRWIPNPDTYNNLFRDWTGVVTDIDIDEIPAEDPLTDGAILARAEGNARVFLVSNNMKRWITSPAVMDKYHFNWDRVYQVPHILLDFIATGFNWS